MSGDHNIQEKHIRKFQSLCRQLNALIVQIRKDEPKANLYLQEDSMCLMKAESHSADVAGRPQQENVVEQVLMRHAGGGAW